MKKCFLLACLFVAMGGLYPDLACAQIGDNRDGTFSNPVIWADVPDPDVIRVGDDFYMVSTTMHLVPGAPVMHSKDLVNWEVISYLYDRLDGKPAYDLKESTMYGRGQWATSLRYHNGTYYAYFSPNDTPYKGYVYTTSNPRKGWKLLSRIPHFHDASLFFDDDGKAYVFYGTGQLRELKPDLSGVMPGGVKMKVFERDEEENALLEGSRVIKHEGKYYLLMISWPKGGKRRQVCYRADKITGPYEKKVILEDAFDGFPYVAQGTIIDDGKGNWYGVIFQDRNGVGRVLTLMPCRWIDGWPMLGDENGHVPATMRKPVQGYAAKGLVVSDDFKDKKLKLNWQWNHNPMNDCWSLKERKGYLRLKTGRIVDNLFVAPNTLTQRMEGPECSGVVCMDLSGMKDGDVAGLSAFNSDAGILAVTCKGNQKFLTMKTESVQLDKTNKAVTDIDRKEIQTIPLTSDKIYLRVDGDFRLRRDIASFYYSYDNKDWKRIGPDFKMIFDFRRFFMGTKFALFNYATKTLGGFVDIDSFEYKHVDK